MFRYGIPSLLLLGSLLAGIFYLKPAWDEFRQIKAETDHVRALSAEFDDLIQNRDALIAKLNLVSKEDLRKLEALIPQSPQSLEFLIALQQASQESGIGLTFTKADIAPPASSASSASLKSPRTTSAGTQPETSGMPGAATAGATPRPGSPQMLNPSEQPAIQAITIKDLPVGIDISGSYETVKKFLGRLERFGRLTDISSLNFSAKSSSGDQSQSSDTFTFSMSLITHYQ
ncbi:MAG: hypothetical protein HY617_02555 [Candidatus Sungbacteria bacterium]|nr:hypothetical protein [Candidatus Sungbacteria bacterium]